MSKSPISIKVLVEVITYRKKKANNKKFTITHYNKDKSLTQWGVTKTGHRYTRKVIVVKSEKELEKIFNKAKKEKDARKNNVTMKVIQYTGKIRKKTLKVSQGRIRGIQIYNVDKVRQRRVGKQRIQYTNDARVVIDSIKLLLEEYNIKFDKYNIDESIN